MSGSGFRDRGSENLLYQRDVNRALLEKAMKQRCVSYLANIKARVLIETVSHVGASKRTLLDAHKRLETALQRLSQEERARVEAEQRLHNIITAVEHAPSSFVLSGEGDRLEFANACFRSAFPSATEGTNLVEFFSKHFGAAADPLLDALRRRRAWKGEIVQEAGKAPRRFYLIHLDHFAAGVGFPGGSALVLEDVTASRLSEERLRRHQRLEAVGQMTGGVAHDVNNLLMVISAETSALQDALVARPDLAPHLQAITEAVERGAKLTRHMLAFARRGALKPTQVDINHLTTTLARMMQRTLGESHTIDLQLSSSRPVALCDAGQLEAAVMNLVLNARDASPAGSTITVRTQAREVQVERPLSFGSLCPGSYVSISVEDTGSGIAPHVLEHIFEPFFSTKGAGEHSGLGLSMVSGFVQQSGGGIEVSSEAGRGTIMTIHLPRIMTPTTAPRLAASERIVLLLEDDSLVREGIARLLRGLGFVVREAATESEALALFPGPGAAAALITDVVLAESRSGLDVARVLRQRDPSLAVLFVSGYCETMAGGQPMLTGKVGTLEKPFTREQLKAELERLLPG